MPNYTTADLHAEAARLGSDLDPVDMRIAMADRKPWDALSDEEFDVAFGEVVRLTDEAADTSRWAVDLGACGLEPSTQSVSVVKSDGKPVARVHFAFAADMSDEARAAFVKGVSFAFAVDANQLLVDDLS